MICEAEPEAHLALHRFRVSNKYAVICENCLPELFGECSKIVMLKSISGSYAADAIFTVQKRIEQQRKKLL
jgi:hypothetical protein